MNCSRPAAKAWIFCLLSIAITATRAQGQVRFIPNAGQWPEPFQFRADVPGGAAFLEGNKIWYNFSNGAAVAHNTGHPPHGESADTIERGHAIALEYLNTSPHVSLSAEDIYPTLYNYYIGTEQFWRSGLKASKNVRYKNLYDKIDMVVTGESDGLKYTYYARRGANASDIRVKIIGAKTTEVRKGALRIITSVNEIIEDAPKAWQWEGDKKLDVPVRYVLRDNVVSFEFPQGYNDKLDLEIDPFVVFASYTGSTADNFGYTATYDDAGHAYAGGDVWAQGYPTTPGAYDTTFNGTGKDDKIGIDVAIMKYQADGKSLVYATYLGGKKKDRPHSMIVNHQGNLVVFGSTVSADFPVTSGAYDTNKGDTLLEDIFVAILSPDGTKLVASTFIGGSGNDGVNRAYKQPLEFNYADEYRGEVIVDQSDNVYVASVTHSTDFPGSKLVKFGDACVLKLDKGLTKLVWANVFGGTRWDAAYSLQLDTKGNLFVSGGTSSPYFFDDKATYDTTLDVPASIKDSAQKVDAFVCQLSGVTGNILNGTYFGTNDYEQAYFVQLDSANHVFLYGQNRTDSFPTVNARYYDTKGSQFITIFNHTLDTIVLSTRFGSGSKIPNISPTAFLVDNCGKIYVSGWGGGTNDYSAGAGGSTKNMRTTPDAIQKTTDGSDFYIAVFAPMMDTILYGTYFGNTSFNPVYNSYVEEHVDGGTSRFDKNGVIYQSICGSCWYTTKPNPDPITTPGAWSRVNQGISHLGSTGCNNLLLKMDVRVSEIVAEFSATPVVCKADTAPVYVSFKNTSKRGKVYEWDFGDETVSSDFEPVHAFTDTGVFRVRLVVMNPSSCSFGDTTYRDITVVRRSGATFRITDVDCNGVVSFEADGPSAEFSWRFGDGGAGSGKTVSHHYINEGTYTVTLFSDPGTLCADSSKRPLTLIFPKASFTYTIDSCTSKVSFFNTSANTAFYDWDFGDGGTDTVRNPIHIYQSNGTYNVRIIATDTRGCKATVTIPVIVKNELLANFTFVQDTCTGEVKFTNASQNANKYLWKFSDGTTDNTKDPVHFFTQDSLYKITLIAFSASGCSDTLERNIFGHVLPTVDFSYEKDSCSSRVKFKSMVTRGYTIDWDFGDGDTSSERNPVHTYKKRGSYAVSFTINGGTTCAKSIAQNIFVNRDELAPAFIPNVFTPNGDGKNDRFEIDAGNPCHFVDVRIYNRWGQKVFEASGNKLAWDGATKKGVNLPAGVYYYVFKDAIFGDLHGTVTMLRE
jgi:gliding motility-associated-like protein